MPTIATPPITPASSPSGAVPVPLRRAPRRDRVEGGDGAAPGLPIPPRITSTRHSIVPVKRRGADLRSQYLLTFELGMLLALALVAGVFRLPFYEAAQFEGAAAEQEVVRMEEIQQTQQVQVPPPPPRPRLLQVVADDVILEEAELELDASLDIDAPLHELPPPPPVDEGADEGLGEEPEIFMIVEQMPELIGGVGSVQRLIAYPEIARQAGVEGRVIVEFVVDEDGRVVAPTIVRGLGAGLDEEALRAISLARFRPGRQRGTAVRVRMMMPITFRLRD